MTPAREKYTPLISLINATEFAPIPSPQWGSGIDFDVKKPGPTLERHVEPGFPKRDGKEGRLFAALRQEW